MSNRHVRLSVSWNRTAAAVLVASAALSATGCHPVGWLANAIAGGDKKVQVDAAYHGLEQQRIGVLVAAPDTTLFQYPHAPLKVCRAVSTRITANVPGAAVADPGQMIEFQKHNPQWQSVPPSRVLDQLNMDRLVLIDLAQYTTHEPGNTHLFKGEVVGNIGVVAADSDDPNNYVYSEVITAFFPETGLGLLQDDAQTVELGLIERFSNKVAGLFYDHTVIRR